MQTREPNLRNILRTVRYVLAGLILTLAGLITLLPAPLPVPSSAKPALQGPPGGWQTYANGDNIQALAVQGEILWVGTRAGGVIRWDLTTGGYTQYLYPQTGLACNDVRDIYVAPNGNVGFATCRGLSVLAVDGTWHTFTTDNTNGKLPSDNVTALATDPAGNLWVGTDQIWNGYRFEGGGLARWDWATAEWQSFNVPTSPAIVDVAVSPDGKVWVATRPFTTWVPPTDDEPGYWGRQGGGLAVWDGTKWDSYTSESDVADSILALGVDTAGNTWVGTAGNGVFVFTPVGRIQFRARGNGLADGYVGAIGFGPDGRIWLATQKFNGRGTGISVLDPGSDLANTDDDRWQRFTVEDGLPANLVTAMVTRGGDLWLGTGDPDGHGRGITRFDGASFRPPLLTRLTNLTGNQITALAESPDGWLWIGTAHSGVSVLSPDRQVWVTYTRENTDPDGRPPWTGLRGNTISAIAIDAAGRAWIGTRRTIYNVQLRSFEDGGLSLFDPTQNTWTSFTQRSTDDDGSEPWRGLRSDEVSAVAVDWDGRIWVGSGSLESFTGRGISVLDTAGTPDFLGDDTWQHYDIFDRVPSNNITAIVVDHPRRHVWVATAPFWTNGVRAGGGVGRFDGTNWTRWNDRDGIVAAENEIRALTVGPQGEVWAGGWTYRGSFHWPSGMGIDAVVNRFDGTGWQVSQIWEDDGYVASLMVTTDGAVWAGTSKDSHGDAPATGGVKWLADGQWTSLTTDNTRLVDNEIHALLQDHVGDLWFGGRTNGLSRLGREIPVPPTLTPQSPTLPAPTPASTPTSTPQVPINRTHIAFLPLLLLDYTGLQLPPTFTPQPTWTAPATQTAPPAATPTPTLTLRPGITPTQTNTPTLTPTFRPTATPTPTRPRPTTTPTPTPKPVPRGRWVPVLNVPPVDLFALHFVEVAGAGLRIWAVGEEGVILVSADSGENWVFQSTPTQETLRDVYFVSQQQGWAVGDAGVILHTLDGGQTWQLQNSPVSDETLVAVAMTSPTDGWVLGAEGSVLRWNGTRWSVQASTNYLFTALALTGPGEGWATTAEADTIGRIIRLENGRWTPVATFQGLQAVHVPAPGQGWAAGRRGTVVRQLGDRWEYVSRPPAGGQALYAIHGLSPDQSWVMGSAGLMFYFNNQRWENKTDSRVTRQTLRALAMTPDGRLGWAVGEAGLDAGTILRFVAEP